MRNVQSVHHQNCFNFRCRKICKPDLLPHSPSSSLAAYLYCCCFLCVQFFFIALRQHFLRTKHQIIDNEMHIYTLHTYLQCLFMQPTFFLNAVASLLENMRVTMQGSERSCAIHIFPHSVFASSLTHSQPFSVRPNRLAALFRISPFFLDLYYCISSKTLFIQFCPLHKIDNTSLCIET